MGNYNSTKRGKAYSKSAGHVKSNELSNALAQTAAIHKGPILGICSNKLIDLFTCSDDNKIALSKYDGKQNNSIKYYEGHSKAVNKVLYTENSNSLWSASRDLSLKNVILLI